MRAHRRWAVIIARVLALLVPGAPPLAAQTVDEIIKRGKVIVGVNTTTPIFGLAGPDGQPEGYDPDVARLRRPSISASRSSSCRSPAANRLPFLLTNRVDMVIALVRASRPSAPQQIWFSIPYATEAAVLVAPASRAVKTVDDLGGLRVGVPRGAMQDLILTPQAAARRSTSCASTTRPPRCRRSISGQIDVVGTGLLVNRTLNRNDPGKNYEVKIVLRPLHFGIGIRRGQTELLQWLNTFIYTIKNNGELDAISRKWRAAAAGALPVF